MNGMTRVLMSTLLISVLAQCTPLRDPATLNQQQTTDHEANDVQGFNQLTLNGARVMMKPGENAEIQALSDVVISGEHNNVTLDHELRRGDYPFDAVIINQNLRQISMAGYSRFMGEKVALNHLDVMLHNNAIFQVKGVIGLNHLTLQDNSRADIRWIDTHDLTINAQGGEVHLAGVVSNLYVMASGDSRLDLDDLRADRVWVSASDQAKVAVDPQKLFYGQASNQSTIVSRHYIPSAFTQVISDHANVIYDSGQVIPSQLPPMPK